MLSAFWYGYVVTMPFGGLIASRFGPHRVLFAGAFMRGVIVALNPAGALLSPYALIALEAARGLVGVYHRFDISAKFCNNECIEFNLFCPFIVNIANSIRLETVDIKGSVPFHLIILPHSLNFVKITESIQSYQKYM